MPTPLILAFHGKGQEAAQFEGQTQLSDPKFNDWAIVAYPQGIDEQWTGDPASPLRSSIDDIAFTFDLLDYLVSHYSIDRSRIYALGFSNGGGLTYLLAGSPTLSARFAAFAIASGAIYKDAALKEPLFSKPLPNRTPIPILHFHGDRDPVIHYDGVGTPDGPTYAVEKWLEGWAKWNGVEGEGEREELYDSKVERRVWMVGRKAVVARWLLRGFGHGWPSTRRQDDDDQRLGPVAFDGAGVVVEWFQGWALEEKGDEVEEGCSKEEISDVLQDKMSKVKEHVAIIGLSDLDQLPPPAHEEIRDCPKIDSNESKNNGSDYKHPNTPSAIVNLLNIHAED
ncbi:hypothetical protein MMC17_009402 [Xylographa soralifera]|nr:hypothetical protein [Xylographa soralifera]